VILDQHDIAGRIVRIERARRVGDHEDTGAKPPQEIDGTRYILWPDALEEMEASLHDHGAPAEQAADDELALVARRR
jgi:hypothetical protein